MSPATLIADFSDWLSTLPPDFTFLLALPFVVGLAGLLRHALTRERKSQPEAMSHKRSDWGRAH